MHDNASVAANVKFVSESDVGYLQIHENAQVNRAAELDFSGGLVLERGVLISAEAIIYTHDHGKDPRSAPAFSKLLVREGAWIGVRAIVLPSVNYIGKNSVIGAGAVVVKDVPDGATFVGAKGRFVTPKGST
jgi:acetyltransferase-like isoleucine patch superfamily enzyme